MRRSETNVRTSVLSPAMALADSRQRIADEHVDDTSPAVRRDSDDRPRRRGVHTADDGSRLAAGHSTKRCQGLFADSGGDNRHQLSLIGNVERVEAQKLA